MCIPKQKHLGPSVPPPASLCMLHLMLHVSSTDTVCTSSHDNGCWAPEQQPIRVTKKSSAEQASPSKCPRRCSNHALSMHTNEGLYSRLDYSIHQHCNTLFFPLRIPSNVLLLLLLAKGSAVAIDSHRQPCWSNRIPLVGWGDNSHSIGHTSH